MTYLDVVMAVQVAITPLMEAHAAKLQVMHEIKLQFSQLTGKVVANECRIWETFQDFSELKAIYENLQKSNFQLSIKVDDLENRSRRCNLRIIGIPERA